MNTISVLGLREGGGGNKMGGKEEVVVGVKGIFFCFLLKIRITVCFYSEGWEWRKEQS